MQTHTHTNKKQSLCYHCAFCGGFLFFMKRSHAKTDNFKTHVKPTATTSSTQHIEHRTSNEMSTLNPFSTICAHNHKIRQSREMWCMLLHFFMWLQWHCSKCCSFSLYFCVVHSRWNFDSIYSVLNVFTTNFFSDFANSHSYHLLAK